VVACTSILRYEALRWCHAVDIFHPYLTPLGPVHPLRRTYSLDPHDAFKPFIRLKTEVVKAVRGKEGSRRRARWPPYRPARSWAIEFSCALGHFVWRER
jgi:hypothetical protein